MHFSSTLCLKHLPRLTVFKEVIVLRSFSDTYIKYKKNYIHCYCFPCDKYIILSTSSRYVSRK